MKNTWLVIGVIAIVLGIVGIIAIGAFAYLQRPAAPVAGVIGQGWNMTLAPHAGAGMGGMMIGNSMMGNGGFGQIAGQQNSLIEIAAKDLDVTATDLVTELQKGKSIADVAKEKNVSTDKIVDDFVATNAAALKSAVEAKQLTQPQADAMLALIKANAAQVLTRTQATGAFGFGMMGNWNGAAPCGQNYPGGRGGVTGGPGMTLAPHASPGGSVKSAGVGGPGMMGGGWR